MSKEIAAHERRELLYELLEYVFHEHIHLISVEEYDVTVTTKRPVLDSLALERHLIELIEATGEPYENWWERKKRLEEQHG